MVTIKYDNQGDAISRDVPREAQRQRELQAAQRLAETERQSALRLRKRNRALAVAGALVCTGVYLVVGRRHDIRYLGAFVVGPVLLTPGLRADYYDLKPQPDQAFRNTNSLSPGS